MMTAADRSPADLRLRAHHLDHTAARLEGSLVMTLQCRADERTWRGGLASMCRDDLHMVRLTTAALASTLRAQAAETRRRASALEWVPP
jgi:hypothetical protein